MSKSKAKAEPISEDVYSKFILFLKSPMWALPVMGFIEQRSIVFDKEQGEEKLYKQIHDEFRSMVDMLIGCFCEDAAIKPNQINVEISKDNKGKNRPEIEMGMLEPVLAAGDYDIFIHMMMRKNIELQLQALQMIEAMCGTIPQILMPGGGKVEDHKKSDDEDDPEHQERVILIQVMRQSKDDAENEKGKAKKELEEALKASDEEKKRLEAAKSEEDELVQKAMAMSLDEAKKPARPASAAKTKDSNKVQRESLEARQEYLRKQRDKLLNMKREARLKAFSVAEANGKRNRPKTARAAKSAMGSRGSGPSAPAKIDPEVLEARKALARKLKSEVMGQR